MGFTESLGGQQAPPRQALQRIGSAPHRRAATACLIEPDDGGVLQFGKEVPLHFEVAPRRVAYRASENGPLRLLAMSRLEVVAANAEHEGLVADKDLVVVAWPYSLGMVACCPFRKRVRPERVLERQAGIDDLHAHFADKHAGDLVALLDALDGLKGDPYWTDQSKSLAGRFLVGEFLPVNFGVRSRTMRSDQQGGAPGWLLGLCEYEKSRGNLETSLGDIAVAAQKIAGSRVKSAKLKKRVAAAGSDARTAATRAIGMALGGRKEAAQDRAVLDHSRHIAATVLEVALKSAASSHAQEGGDFDAARDNEPDQGP
ncbi:MAG: hypothetical protein AB8H80_23735 [Planctomycetota bacterium]